MSRGVLVVAIALYVIASPLAQESDPKLTGIDYLLDAYVRDGEVYYRALKSDRAKLDTYVASLAAAPVAQQPREAQLAFWLNAYNALVLRTVIDHYPVSGRSHDYPAKSIRQIPGAFERLTHRVGGKTLTLSFGENENAKPFTFYEGQLVFPNIPKRRGFWEKIE